MAILKLFDEEAQTCHRFSLGISLHQVEMHKFNTADLPPANDPCYQTAPHRHFTPGRQYKQQPRLTGLQSLLHNGGYLGTVISVIIIIQHLFIIRNEALETAEGHGRVVKGAPSGVMEKP